ncbi:MAG: hypothetical protein Q4E50_03145 [Tissierellia bacterium]|nr:hypothetical protein [Tissierellia bacterium]
MIKKIAKLVIAIIGLLLGYSLMLLLLQTSVLKIGSVVWEVIAYIIAMLICGVGLYLLSDKIIRGILSMLDRAEKTLADIPAGDIAFGATGLLFGLIMSFFISYPLRSLEIPFFGNVFGLILTIIIYIVLGSVGARLSLRYKEDVIKLFAPKYDLAGNDRKKTMVAKREINRKRHNPDQALAAKLDQAARAKTLDTSVLIDGRVASIVDSGFLEGPLVIPEFVLEELQFIADSADDLKRERGRRGLDIVKKLQDSKKVEVLISDMDYDDTAEVDIKLLKLTKDLDGKVMTNDYNLNKVASVQGIPVLNINDLANAVKTVVIPGEHMHVTIIKEGKEKKQGLAYLDDGTMIVVEDARDLIGKEIDVVVTTVLQTAAGKMIFAKPE